MWSVGERLPLREEELRRALVVPGGPYAALDVVASLPSTNTALVAAARKGAPDRTVLVAEYQSAGRGRAARSWEAPARSGLALSVLLRPAEVPPCRWGWLSLLAGVVLCRTVTTMGAIPAALKWPNDLLIGADQRKAAGILAEVVPGPPAPGLTGMPGLAGSGLAVVLGIGLNVTVQPDELPVPTATSLAIEQAVCTDRDALLRALLNTLHGEVLAWCEQGGDPDATGLRDDYVRWCRTLGEQVLVELPGQPALTGRAVDIDAEGRLEVWSGGKRHALAAGDVTHIRSG